MKLTRKILRLLYLFFIKLKATPSSRAVKRPHLRDLNFAKPDFIEKEILNKYNRFQRVKKMPYQRANNYYFRINILGIGQHRIWIYWISVYYTSVVPL